jgi:hypothetical protein
MDRISALRNVEEALREFERGNLDLATMERRVATVLRTYATEFEGDGEDALAAYRASGESPADGLVVVASSPTEARGRVEALLDESCSFEIEPV